MFRTILVISTLTYVNAMYCSYPAWGIPGAGDDYRCDWDECPMRVERDCIVIGLFAGDQCEVTCANDASLGSETWECVNDEEWKLVSKHINCDGVPDAHEEPEVVDAGEEEKQDEENADEHDVPEDSGAIRGIATATTALFIALVF